MAREGLTPKQEMFVQGRFKGLSQREAYKGAFNAENMKDATIDRRAFDLANKGKIEARLKQLQDEFKERNMVTKDRVLEELAKIGFADIKDFLDYRTEQSVVGADIEGRPAIDYRPIIEVKDSSKVDGTLISEVSIGKDGTFKFKLHDKMAALEKMGKTLGMFVEKSENKNLNVDTDLAAANNMTDAEIAAELEKLGFKKVN